jgi:hypothetical protein
MTEGGTVTGAPAQPAIKATVTSAEKTVPLNSLYLQKFFSMSMEIIGCLL